MISLEMARKLKGAGLKWEPRAGDWFYNGHGYCKETTHDLIHEVTVRINNYTHKYQNKTVWFAPRLDQLLAEIERRGYWWSIENGLAEYLCFFVKQDGKKFIKQSFWADSPEEAAVKALIWILEQKQATD